MASAAEGSEQRGRGWRRFFSKLRDTVKRIAINSAAPSKAMAQEPMADPQQPRGMSAAVDKLDAEPPTSARRGADLQPSRAYLTIINTPLTPDDSIDTDDIAEPPLPMLSTRTALSDDRAQRLFEKYGLKYEPRIASKETELTHDVRRVQKSIRVRIHYSCEECGTSFGSRRICAQCGHRRCTDCHRDPARRVREVLNEARQQQQQHRAQEWAQQASSEQNQLGDVPMPIRTVSTSNDAADSATSHPMPTEQGAIVSDEIAEATQYQYVTQHCPRSAVQLLLRSGAQLVRRTCHECETHFEPANRMECQTCRHHPCKLCPLETQETATQESLADEQQQLAPAPVMAATVQRVYKKARQRVRWTCDQCQALFLDRDRCQECGHVKCDECIRSPYVYLYISS
jgi:hypothetical protein